LHASSLFRSATFCLREFLANFLVVVDGLAGGEIFQLEKLPDFDFFSSLGPWGQELFWPSRRFLPRFHINNPVAGNQLSGLGEGPSMTEVLLPEKRTRNPFALDWSPAGSTRTPSVTSSSLYLAIAGKKFFAGQFAGFTVFVAVDDHHESHGSLLTSLFCY